MDAPTRALSERPGERQQERDLLYHRGAHGTEKTTKQRKVGKIKRSGAQSARWGGNTAGACSGAKCVLCVCLCVFCEWVGTSAFLKCVINVLLCLWRPRGERNALGVNSLVFSLSWSRSPHRHTHSYTHKHTHCTAQTLYSYKYFTIRITWHKSSTFLWPNVINTRSHTHMHTKQETNSQ